MRLNERKKILRKLLLKGNGRSRLWAALTALCVGTALLLLAVMIWWNFQELLQGRGGSDSLGSTFLTVSKRVTDQNMGKPQLTVFSPDDIEAMRNAPQVQDVGVLTSNRFPVYATLSSSINFSTEMFLEAVPDRFIDKKPVDWYWQPSTSQVPIIVSSEFLNLYNYGFALSQGLPQLSESSIKSLAFDLKAGTGDNEHVYTAHVVGFSDRISSVLVPESFIEYGNKMYANVSAGGEAPSRLIIKAKDPSEQAFVKYLQQRDYVTNREQLRWNKVRAIVQIISGATGVLAILLMGIGTLVFILFIELTIARAQQSITLLLELGYSPRYLSRFIIKRFLPLVLATVAFSMILAIIAQVVASSLIKNMNLSLSFLPGWPVWATLIFSTVLLLMLISNSISKSINNNI